MDKDDLSLLPIEARPYQGTAAGVASRVVANTIDGLLVAVVFLDTVAVYLAFSWWMGGRTLGARVMGLQVVMRHGRGPLGFVRALARAALCAWFPIGLLWCVVDPSRRSVQDIVLRT